MEPLIRSQNFVHDDENIFNKFKHSFNDLNNEDEEIVKRGPDDILKCLNALRDKLTAESKPALDTKGWEMAHWAFQQIQYIACRYMRDNSSDTVLKGFYSFMICIVDKSYVFLNVSIAYECLNDYDLKLKEHIQALDKTNLLSLLKVMCKPVKAAEAVEGVYGRKYGAVYYDLMKCLIETLTKDQVQEVYEFLLDYAVYCYLDTTDLTEETYEEFCCAGDTVMSVLKDPFETFNNIEKIKSYIRRLTALFKSKTFAPNKTVSKKTKDFMERKMMKFLAKRGLLEELYDEMFDLLMAISKCTYTIEGDTYLKDLFYGAQIFFSNYETKSPTKNADIFEKIVKRFIKVVEELDMKFLIHSRFVYSAVDDAIKKLYANNKQLSKLWISMLVPLFKKPCLNTMRGCYTITSECKAVKWKEHIEIANQMIEGFKSFPMPPSKNGMDKKEKEETKETYNYFNRTVEYFFDGLKKDKLTKSYGKDMMELSLKFLNSDLEVLNNLAESIAEKTELNIKEDKNAAIETMKKLHELLKDENLQWATNWSLYRAANDLIECATEPFKDGKIFTNEDLEVFVSICLTCLKYDCLNPETNTFPSGHFSMFLAIIKSLIKWLEALNKMDLAAPLVPELIKCLDVDDENVVTIIGVYIMTIGRVTSGQKVAAPYLDKLISVYLEKENNNLLYAITELYPSNPKALKNHYKDLMQLFEDSGDPHLITQLAQLFQHVSKKQAELFTSEDIEVLFNKAQEQPNSQVLILQILQELCKRCPEKMTGHLHHLFDKSAWSLHCHYFVNDMKATLASYSKEIASQVLKELFDDIKTNQDKTFLLVSFNTIRIIGFKYPDLLKARKSELETLAPADPDILAQKKMLLDMIDGKTPDDMVKLLKKQEAELASLIGRVDETEETLSDLKDDVSKQGEQLDNVKNEVKEQGQKINNIEVKVEETAVKVEEIDKKTLSHAPFWSRDISKLLNPKSEHDWRLLSSRLGYSNDDIRGWAQQSDPCMALLNEWYATHKTSEATLAVLTQLQEMNRLDAAAIVENAMKNAEAVVEDEGFVYASPPPIFISYQWSHQAEVKLLKQHLEMAGYECWLDIGQMGGGDKLFEKIDSGIRAAKVIISCVTGKYAKSPNCNREVNLSVSLNKPIIPLLLEQCPWPPPGSMGPIFSEYLFIRFFQRPGEEMSDQRYWAKDKFQELLMQLNVVGLAPEEGKVLPEYKNWWIPVVQEIKIDKSKTQNRGKTAEVVQSELDKIATESPDIFISYQWGKQKNILKLYERLTSHGFSCWLDIKQMGGGDSLYDKIDKGIRGCKVVLSCVTQKYSLSANCRREVSLTDALKKPMIPLLLEKMTWPPSGPMSMVMTQLLYINFSKDESIQMTWEGPEFNELLKKIQEFVPKIGDTAKINSQRPGSNGKSTDGAKPSTIIKPIDDIKSTAPIAPAPSKTTQKTAQNSNPNLQQVQRKLSQPSKPASLAPLKQPPKTGPLQKSPITSPPSTASSQSSSSEPVKKPNLILQKTSPVKAMPSTKPFPTANSTKPTAKNDNNPINIAPSSKPLLKPIPSETVGAGLSNQNSNPKPQAKFQASRNITQGTAPKPSRLPPLDDQNGVAKSKNPVKKDEPIKPNIHSKKI